MARDTPNAPIVPHSGLTTYVTLRTNLTYVSYYIVALQFRHTGLEYAKGDRTFNGQQGILTDSALPGEEPSGVGTSIMCFSQDYQEL